MWTWRDYFCGGGTAALAAQDVGFRVELGVDCDAVALKAFRRNIAGGRVVCERLGDKPLDKDFWESGAEPTLTHCHFSPPCQEVSNAKGPNKDPVGVELLQWSVRQAVATKCGSWSVETVVSQLTRVTLDELCRELFRFDRSIGSTSVVASADPRPRMKRFSREPLARTPFSPA